MSFYVFNNLQQLKKLNRTKKTNIDKQKKRKHENLNKAPYITWNVSMKMKNEMRYTIVMTLNL